MSSTASQSVEPLPEPVSRLLDEFVSATRTAFGDGLQAIVLFGSAAENRLRATSDVNVTVVLSAFDRAGLDALRPTLLRAQAAIRLEVLWLLESEIGQAAEAFAVKFSDIGRRHRVLFGSDPFAHLTVSRAAALSRVRQVLLNLLLRLRASYAVDGEREERLTARIADAAAPLRVSAAEILELEGGPRLAPRAALIRLAGDWTDPGRDAILGAISDARDTRHLEPGRARDVLLGLVDLADFLHRRAQALS